MGKVFIAGFVPYWVDTNVVRAVPVKDETDNKHCNILHAIEEAIRTGELSECFLYSSDDHFYTQPVDFAEYPIYWRGKSLPDTLPAKPRWYDITLKSTHDVLAAMSLPTHFFAWHGNTWFNTRIWQQQRMVLLRRLAQTMPKMIVRKDGKITPADTIAEVQRKAAAKEVISSTDCAGMPLRAWLQSEFPHKSIYERD